MHFIEIEAIAVALHSHIAIAAAASVTFQSFTFNKKFRSNFFWIDFIKLVKLPGLIKLPTTKQKNSHKLQENMTTLPRTSPRNVYLPTWFFGQTLMNLLSTGIKLGKFNAKFPAYRVIRCVDFRLSSKWATIINLDCIHTIFVVSQKVSDREVQKTPYIY